MRYTDTVTWLMCLSYFDGCCAYCGASHKKLTGDHLIPRSAGGQDTASNIVPACEDCNQSKADADWREWLMKRDDFCQERMNKIYSWRRVCKQAGQ